MPINNRSRSPPVPAPGMFGIRRESKSVPESESESESEPETVADPRNAAQSLDKTTSMFTRKPGSSCDPHPTLFPKAPIPLANNRDLTALRLLVQETIAKLGAIEVGLRDQLGVLRECADSLDVLKSAVG
ncbi:unnamed protein product [Tuber aestivum]|uniref:Uncharacterized protein n=1 Tax=Tuber aestivum TaxID=59557 RepID=A0A292PQK1_9PEZI|nr:unnamed protein product [Tuber aestivum]